MTIDERVIRGIERDYEHNISPWLQATRNLPGGPADRAGEHIVTLLKIVRECMRLS